MFPYSLKDFREAYQECGFQVTRYLTFEFDSSGNITKCCPIGAIRAAKYSLKIEEDVWDLPEDTLSCFEVGSFMLGFDGRNSNQDFDDEEKEAYVVGQQVYEQFHQEGLI